MALPRWKRRRIFRVELDAPVFRSHDLETTLRCCQFVYWEILCFAVEGKLEPVRQQRLEHGPHLRECSIAISFRDDVVAVGVNTGVSSGDLKIPDVVCHLD